MITAEVFHAHLKCPTKAHLKNQNTAELQREFADHLQRQVEGVISRYSAELVAKNVSAQFWQGVPFAQIPNASEWQVALDCLVQTPDAQSQLHAIERISSLGKSDGTSVQITWIPIRCISTERVSKNDRLLLAFDSICLAEECGLIPVFGKIVCGNGLRVTKIQLSGLIEEARKLLATITSQNSAAPPLVLNRHCMECEFQSHCRRVAVEKDELSLLSSMTENEREAYRSKGIFTVTQLSYTFRPRRRPKRLASKPEPYHHALRALAIRENKIHIAGQPELKTHGTAVYLDVEGNADFYYLIGAQIRDGETIIQRSFWADSPADEAGIWAGFQAFLAPLADPQLIHYGSYETTFLKRMKERYGASASSASGKTIDILTAEAINLISVTYAKIYFPTYSNGLKEVAGHLGYHWTDAEASGAKSVLWRREWETTKRDEIKQKLLIYNREDCAALEAVTKAVNSICGPDKGRQETEDRHIVEAASVKVGKYPTYGRNPLALPEFQQITKASYWDYQRERITIRDGKRPNSPKVYAIPPRKLPINKIISCAAITKCPNCGSDRFLATARHSKIIYDLKFSPHGVKRWIVKYIFDRFRCSDCETNFCSEEKSWTRHRFGTELLAYIIYHVIEIKISQSALVHHLRDICDCIVHPSNVKQQKERASTFYSDTYSAISRKILSGPVIYIDETKANVKGAYGYVWVLTNSENVLYFYTETREGERIQKLLQNYRGVIVSDFYAVYDAIQCPQQKCLLHLMRDLNDSLLREPYNAEMKDLVRRFADVLKAAVATIDRFGLKTRHLRKHKKDVDRFFENLSKSEFQTETASKCKQRLEKNRDKLFTFLDYDGVSWNNNNAEHAVKAFAAIREVVRGSCTKKGLDEYLTLLSVCQTCKYKDVSFLNFLRSGGKDIDEFASRGRSRKKADSVAIPEAVA